MSSVPPGPPPPSDPSPSFEPAAPSRRRNALPKIVGGAVVLVLAIVVVLVVTLTGSKAAADARSVQDVADLAVSAAQDLDVDAGVDLLCAAPGEERVQDLNDLIEKGQEKAGTADPDVDYAISDLEGDSIGSFTVTITSDEDGLEGRTGDLVVVVGRDGDRSCITEFNEGDGTVDEPIE